MLKKILISFGIIAILLTILTQLSFNYWLIRVFDFPHIQLTFLTAIAIATYFIKFDFKSKSDYAFLTVLVLCFVYQFSHIYPYTKFAKYDIKNATPTKDTIAILGANVKQKNKKYQKLIKQIKKHNPDILLVTETNAQWLKELQSITSEKYQYKKEYPLENTYGIALYSKFPLQETSVEFLVSDTIPSIHTKVNLPNNTQIQLYAIHPTPPILGQNKSSAARDSEMMMIAKKSMDAKLPVIVLGDFNDVAWSETTKLFENVSGLLDVRKGRGIYNTYNAENILTRWPLDHLFASEEFRVKTIKTTDKIGSDHFPFYVSLSFEPEKASEQKPEKPSESELKRMQDQIDKVNK